jgi:predicted nucleic-acid-binding protein
MIGVDTSVIVRYLVGTPVDQAGRAASLIDGSQELGVSIVALIETAHVLRTQYGVPRGAVVDTLIDLVTRENLVTIELSKPDVLEALVAARSFPSAPIPDALIVAAARSSGAVPVYTFDRDLGRLGAPIASP